MRRGAACVHEQSCHRTRLLQRSFPAQHFVVRAGPWVAMFGDALWVEAPCCSHCWNQSGLRRSQHLVKRRSAEWAHGRQGDALNDFVGSSSNALRARVICAQFIAGRLLGGERNFSRLAPSASASLPILTFGMSSSMNL